MPYVGKKPADIIATAVDTTTGDFSGNVNVTSAVDEGPISVTLFVPLSLSSKNSINPDDVAPFFNCNPVFTTGVVIVGVVKVLLVSVFVVADR